MLLLFSGGDAARSKLGGRLLPTSNPGMQQNVAEARPTDSSGQRAYFPLALQVHSGSIGSDIGIIWWEWW